MERALEAFVGRTPRRSQGGGITRPPDRVPRPYSDGKGNPLSAVIVARRILK